MAVFEGLLNINKPANLTSHDIVDRVRRLSGLRRIGHAGTLDPLATGVLLLCLGRATRLVEYLVGQPKQYETTVRLGQATTTYDAAGEVVSESAVDVSQAELLAALDNFRGSIWQRPPMYSAVKKNGQPLYKLARQGIDIERPARQVTVYELTLLEWQAPLLRLLVGCSAGTYIRSLAHDLGQVLGCGAHVASLVRSAIGSFTLAAAVPLSQLNEGNWNQHLLPAEQAVAHLPRIDLSSSEAERLLQGQLVDYPADRSAPSLVRVYDPAGHFIGVATGGSGYWRARKMFPPAKN